MEICTIPWFWLMWCCFGDAYAVWIFRVFCSFSCVPLRCSLQRCLAAFMIGLVFLWPSFLASLSEYTCVKKVRLVVTLEALSWKFSCWHPLFLLAPGVCDSALYLGSSSNQARFCSQLVWRFVHVLPFAFSLFVSGIICLFASLDSSPLYLFPFSILVYWSHGAFV